MRGGGGVDHIMLGVCCGAMGGHGDVGTGLGWDALCGMLSCGGVSGSRPRSYSSCAAGGRRGWRYHASSKVAWWLVFTVPVVVSRYLMLWSVAV